MGNNEKIAFNHVISLGSFCSPALELERYGFRDHSYPFDWVLSHEFESVLDLIENGFKDYVAEDFLYQWKSDRKIYKNTLYDIDFVHDFDKYYNFKDQIGRVSEKYNRRIASFYQSISQPSVFIRYIENQQQMDFITQQFMRIQALLKSFNDNNTIVFIFNDNIELKKDMFNEGIFHKVHPDDNDSVARCFFDQTKELVEFLNHHYPVKERNHNREVYYKKIHHKNKKEVILLSRAKDCYKRHFCAEYVHYNEIDI